MGCPAARSSFRWLGLPSGASVSSVANVGRSQNTNLEISNSKLIRSKQILCRSVWCIDVTELNLLSYLSMKFSSISKYKLNQVEWCEALCGGPRNFCINRVLDPRAERREEDRGETQEETGNFVDVEKFYVKGWICRVFGRCCVFFQFVSLIVGSSRLCASNNDKRLA